MRMDTAEAFVRLVAIFGDALDRAGQSLPEDIGSQLLANPVKACEVLNAQALAAGVIDQEVDAALAALYEALPVADAKSEMDDVVRSRMRRSLASVVAELQERAEARAAAEAEARAAAEAEARAAAEAAEDEVEAEEYDEDEVEADADADEYDEAEVDEYADEDDVEVEADAEEYDEAADEDEAEFEDTEADADAEAEEYDEVYVEVEDVAEDVDAEGEAEVDEAPVAEEAPAPEAPADEQPKKRRRGRPRKELSPELEEIVTAIAELSLDCEPEGDTLTVDQAAAALGIGRQDIYKLIKADKIPAFKKGRSWAIPEAVVLPLQAKE